MVNGIQFDSPGGFNTVPVPPQDAGDSAENQNPPAAAEEQAVSGTPPASAPAPIEAVPVEEDIAPPPAPPAAEDTRADDAQAAPNGLRGGVVDLIA